MGKKAQHPGYKKMKDTPWITQGREIADKGGRGILDNYNSVNVFDDATRQSLENYNNSIYQRAFNDMSRNYNDIMNAYAARNYGRFGSLNNTPSTRAIDDYQRQFQRQLNDATYNKAINYENLINNELQRRYNTLNLFSQMYNYGQTPYQQDLKNWNVENTNRDIAYQNQLINSGSNIFGGTNSGNNISFSKVLGGGLTGAGQGYALTSNPLGAVAGGAIGAIGGMI